MKYAVLALVVSGSVFGATITPNYQNDYSFFDLGPAPGVQMPFGGLAFLAGNPNMLLIAGGANAPQGVIDSLGVVRDAEGHISGFAPSAIFFANAPDIDGGLAYGPDGALFFSRFVSGRVGEIKPGSTGPDFTATINSGLASIGAINFVPEGYSGAGNLVLGSYTNGTFCTAPIIDNGDGTSTINSCAHTTNIGNGGPEGTAYVPQGSPGFSDNTMLVSLYRSGIVAAYQLDANGLPIPTTEEDFLTGMGRVQGAAIDPLSGDLLLSTFNGGNHLYSVRGFAAPMPTPEPGTSLLFGAGLIIAGFAFRARARAAEDPDRRLSRR
ncbi:MAG TPA: PEP-CTERM sorting domain-containing protein [Bryobacteraceae bacterium]|nr:PEP-CTERM sorting domain-containing protein [Bryobacteraceae bacterium]